MYGRKITILSNNNPNELLNRKSEILNIFRHSKAWLVTWQIECASIFYAKFYLFWWPLYR